MSKPKVELHITHYGVITLELDQDKAPQSVNNFLSYVKKGHYDNTIFHRVIPGFMIQGGGMKPGMNEKPCDAPIQNEANNGLKNNNYTVAMARSGDPHSASAQFFINVSDNGFLNHISPSAQGWGYAVFGKVVSGAEVVDKIKTVRTGRKDHHDDVPTEDVVIARAVALLSESDGNLHQTSSPTVRRAEPIQATGRTLTGERMGEWPIKLTNLCAQYTSADFYVAELIPQNKLESAREKYPSPGGGKVIALIDATIFGSAENGMLIGEYGLSWHNDWSTTTKVSALLWTDFWELAISIDKRSIKIGSDGVFDTSASQFDRNAIAAMLIRFQKLWKEEFVVNALPTSSPADIETTPPIPPKHLPPEALAPLGRERIDVNTADFDALLTLPGIGAADAKLLIQHRNSHGRLPSMDDLVKVLSLKPYIVQRLRPLVTFSMGMSRTPEPPKSRPPIPPTPEPTPTPPKSTGPVRAPIDF